MKTGFLCHELYMWHDTRSAALFATAGLTVEPDEHVESPKSKRRFRSLLEVAGMLDIVQSIRPEPAIIA